MASNHIGDVLSTKLVWALERIQKDVADGRKVMIYSQFLDSGISIIQRELATKGISFGVIDGSVPSKERKKVVSDYNQGMLSVIIITMAGAEGIDLKGTRTVIVLEPWFNAGKTQQIVGRAVRYKSHTHLPKAEQHVDIFYLVLKKSNTLLEEDVVPLSVDEYLYRISEAKDESIARIYKRITEESIEKCIVSSPPQMSSRRGGTQPPVPKSLGDVPPDVMKNHILPKLSVEQLLLVNKDMSAHTRRAIQDMCMTMLSMQEPRDLPARRAKETYLHGKGRFQSVYAFLINKENTGWEKTRLELLTDLYQEWHSALKNKYVMDHSLCLGNAHDNDRCKTQLNQAASYYAELFETSFLEKPNYVVDRFLTPARFKALKTATNFLAYKGVQETMLEEVKTEMTKRYDTLDFGIYPPYEDVPRHNDPHYEDARDDWVDTYLTNYVVKAGPLKDYSALLESAMDAEIAAAFEGCDGGSR
jgi:hypothetical protein